MLYLDKRLTFDKLIIAIQTILPLFEKQLVSGDVKYCIGRQQFGSNGIGGQKSMQPRSGYLMTYIWSYAI